ncbi:amidohydrolase family protein [Sporomusa sphaeroides]|uniref:Enamidase n=2 Tax=Sporomusa TaxID=2375 RepID=A0ABM9W5K9_9FIRM|nr:amidohydrolase family protein [Sporomusa sphaeroides]OLS55305.1 enamidase [Sporomusa sphaeroides DSM 2875]CVK20296.1 Enamidase [Sporomusa sphaeroides DSM 2875]SCM83419.1 putative Enamidase [uncultured Sporomusa sp.]
MKKIYIKNLGTIASGDVNNPILDAEVIYAENGVIQYVGAAKADLEAAATTVVDAKGLDVGPALIDAHAHPPMNDYLVEFKATDFATNFMAGGTGSMISVGSSMPGMPYTVAGVKAVAVAGKQIWDTYRPLGSKVYGGALMLVDGLKDSDFAEMAAEGIKVVGEVGKSPVQDVAKAAELTKMARKHGMVVTAHSGGPVKACCASYNADDLLKINPNVICSLNGGPTPMSDADIEKVLKEGDFYYDMLAHGNVRILRNVYKLAKSLNKVDKLMFGTNVPSMSGYSPLGLWLSIAALSNTYQDVHPATFIAMASGNVADCYGLDHGKIAKGYKLDIIFLDGFGYDTCPFKTLQSGNMCSTSFVILDGELRMPHCKNVPGASRKPEFITK